MTYESTRQTLYDSWYHYNFLADMDIIEAQRRMYLRLSRLSGMLMSRIQQDGSVHLDLEEIARILEVSQRTVKDDVRVIRQRTGHNTMRVHYENAA